MSLISQKNWKTVRLGDIAEVVGGGTPSTKESLYWDGNIPWITPKDLSGYQSMYIEKGERGITEEGVKNSSVRLLPENSILFSSRAPIGYIAINKIPVTTNQGFKSLIPNKETDYKFLYYWLLHNKGNIEKQASGSTFAEVSGSVMKNFEIQIPESKTEQKEIAGMLGCLDDKIELLRRENKTLESIAQTLFKEWFVDFNFPGSNEKMIDSELSEIPEGWRVGSLTEIADFLNGVASQKFPAESKNDSLPVIKIREMKAGITGDSDRATKNINSEYIVKSGDLLFSWSGSLDVVLWNDIDGVLNQHLFKVTSKDYPKWFYYYWILYHLPEFRSIAQSKATTMGHIQRHHLDNAMVLIPDGKSFKIISDSMSPLLNKQIINNSEIKNLSKIRDSLLSEIFSN